MGKQVWQLTINLSTDDPFDAVCALDYFIDQVKDIVLPDMKRVADEERMDDWEQADGANWEMTRCD